VEEFFNTPAPSRKVGEYLLGAHGILSKKVQKPLICVIRCALPRAILSSARRNVAMTVNWHMGTQRRTVS
jgi:hypothetical protein